MESIKDIKDTLLQMGFAEDLVNSAVLSNCTLEQAITLLLSDDSQWNYVPSQSSNSNYMVTSLESSQYSFDGAGPSSCTAIACVAADNLLPYFPNVDYCHNKDFLNELLFNGVQKYFDLFMGSGHLSVEEYSMIDADVSSRLNFCSKQTQQSLTNPLAFNMIFDEARNIESNNRKYVGVIITKPPETVLVIIPLAQTSDGVYGMFDSHPRSHLGLEGAHFITSHSSVDIIDSLKNIFPPIANEGQANGSNIGGLHLEMYNTIEATFVVLK